MDKHKAIFRGLKERKLYRFGRKDRDSFYYHRHQEDPEIYTYEVFESYADFLEILIDNPPIEIGEKVYLNEIDSILEIKDRYRNSQGGYIYITNRTVEIIDDEETEESRLKAVKEQEEYLKYKEAKLKKQQMDEACVTPINIEPKKKWYQFWK